MNIETVGAAWSTLVAEIGELRAITTLEENRKASALIDQLLAATEADPAHALSGLLDLVSTLVETFETNRFQESEATPAVVLRMLKESNNLTQAELAPIFGGQSVVSAVLRGRRQITASQAGKLAARFGVSAALFIEKPKVALPLPSAQHIASSAKPWGQLGDRFTVKLRVGTEKYIVHHHQKATNWDAFRSQIDVVAETVKIPREAYSDLTAPAPTPGKRSVDLTSQGDVYVH